MALLGPFGCIFISKKVSELKEVLEEYEELMKQVEKLKKDREEEMNLITFVNQLIVQCEDLDGKMDTAVKAMTELSMLFTEQSSCYDKIAAYFNEASGSVDLNSWRLRKQYVEEKLESAIGKIKEVCGAVLPFTSLLMLTSILPAQGCRRGIHAKYSHRSLTEVA